MRAVKGGNPPLSDVRAEKGASWRPGWVGWNRRRREAQTKLSLEVKLLGSRDGFSPFGDDGIALIHGHAGVLGEHDGATAAAPRHEIDEMFLAEGRGPARCINRHGAAFN